MFQPESTPIVIMAEGYFGQPTSKLAIGVLRYGRWPVVAVIDSTQAGKTVGEVVPYLSETPVAAVPVVDNLDAAMALYPAESQGQPKALVLGTAPIGGALPESWRVVLQKAVSRYRLHLINGLHDFLSEDAELVALAKQQGVTLWDVRDPETYDKAGWWPISQHKQRPAHVRVITMVGSDCSVGKMFTALELTRGAEEAGIRAHFVATGQTGIVISGAGVPLDRVISDYAAGYMESAVSEAIQQYSDDQPLWLFVEGQGSLLHPAYSGVTLSLLHGSRPDAMILCHKAELQTIKGGYQTPIPSLDRLVRLYEDAAAWTGVYPAPKMAGISLNTSTLSESAAQQAIAQAQALTNLPATDPVRCGVATLIEQLKADLSA